MTLVLFLTLCVFAITVFAMMPKALSATDNVILLCSNSIVFVSYSTLISLNWGILTNTKHPELFVSFILARSILLQLTMLFQANGFLFCKTAYGKAFVFLLTLAVMEGLLILGKAVKIVDYPNWYAAVSIMVYAAFLSLSTVVGIVLNRSNVEGVTAGK